MSFARGRIMPAPGKLKKKRPVMGCGLDHFRRHGGCLEFNAMRSILRIPLFGLLALVTSAAAPASDSFPTTLPPPLVDLWEVSLRALGAEDLAPEAVDLSPEAPPVASFEEQIA